MKELTQEYHNRCFEFGMDVGGAPNFWRWWYTANEKLEGLMPQTAVDAGDLDKVKAVWEAENK